MKSQHIQFKLSLLNSFYKLSTNLSYVFGCDRRGDLNYVKTKAQRYRL